MTLGKTAYGRRWRACIIGIAAGGMALLLIYSTRTRVTVTNDSGESITWIRISGAAPERVFRSIGPGEKRSYSFWVNHEGSIEAQGQLAGGTIIPHGIGWYLTPYGTIASRIHVRVLQGGDFTVNGLARERVIPAAQPSFAK